MFLLFIPRVKDLCGFNIQLPANSHLCPKPLFSQIAAEFEAINLNEKDFYSHAHKTHFHRKGFAFSLVLKMRVLRTQKWPLSETIREQFLP